MRTVLVLATASALLFAAMASYTSPLDPSVPVIQLTFTASAFHAVLDAWGPAGLTLFKGHFVIDYVFLPCYGALGYVLVRRTGIFRHYSAASTTWLAFMLPAAAAADAFENALHLVFVSGTGTVAQPLYFVAGTVASIKWVLIAVFVGYVAAALVVGRKKKEKGA